MFIRDLYVLPSLPPALIGHEFVTELCGGGGKGEMQLFKLKQKRINICGPNNRKANVYRAAF